MILSAALLLQTLAVGPDSALLRHAGGRVPRTVTAIRVDRTPAIDGRLDDSVWQRAIPAGDFVQSDPHEGQPASESTLVWIVYDDAALYVGARMFDSEPARIERRLARRDAFTASDKFYANFDSYHDHRTAFEFGVSAAGVKQDDITSNDFFFGDRSWEPVWDVATMVDSLGWTAEMRIPFSQLRFPPRREQLWGVQFFREVFRKNELSQFEFKPKNESGYASRFAHLVGLANIPAPRRLEVLPYGVARGTYHRPPDPADPFDAEAEHFGTAGLDAKYGVTSNLTLDATVNPDFGQVEADPAFVNLSAFEQFLEERRPFFVEGASIFEFGYRGGFAGGTPQYFYSRRIGRPPAGYPDPRGGYADVPDVTTILGAGKLTGKSAGGWSVGVLDALTAREYGTVDSAGTIYRDEVEPLTNYFVGRLSRELRGTTGVGVLATAVHRDLDDPDLLFLRSAAYAGAADFFHRWSNNTYSVSGSLGASHIRGDTVAIQAAQRSSARYFQRPDAAYVDYDPERTTLSGVAAGLAVNKEGGNLYWGIGAATTSPGFEVNDLGFQARADRVTIEAGLGYRWTRPGKVLRQANASVDAFRSWNYGGDRTGMRLGAFHFGQFLNYWGYNVNAGVGFRALDDRLTRGGPLAARPAEWNAGGGFFSDGRKRITVSAFAFYERDETGGWSLWVGPRLSARPSAAVSFSVGPGYSVGRSTTQYVSAVPDTTAAATYGARYVFADLEQHSLDVTLRLNVTMSPTLSIEVYAQPFTFAGDYGGFKELRRPRTLEFNVYGQDAGSTVTPGDPASCGGAPPNECAGIDPDGPAGPAEPFPLYNPDFTTRSFQSNAVLRWEYRPGSTLFLVWTHRRSQFVPFDATFDATSDVSDLLLFQRLQPTNVVQLKVNYWLSL